MLDICIFIVRLKLGCKAWLISCQFVLLFLLQNLRITIIYITIRNNRFWKSYTAWLLKSRNDGEHRKLSLAKYFWLCMKSTSPYVQISKLFFRDRTIESFNLEIFTSLNECLYCSFYCWWSSLSAYLPCLEKVLFCHRVHCIHKWFII